MNSLPISRSPLADLGLFIIRVALAAVFLYHGSQKLFGAFGGPGIDGFAGFLASMNVPMPKVSAVLAGAAEFLGGLAMLTGLGIRLIAAPLVFTMLVAFFTAHKGVFDSLKGGGEYPMTLGLVALGVALIGPGRLSLAAALGKQRFLS